MILTLSFLAIFLFALAGAPLFVAILAAALFGFYITEIPLEVIGIELYRIADTPMLVALPLFTLTGYLLAESKCSERLVAVSQSLIGWLPGGLSIIAFITCAFFTAFTGASGVTIVAIGALLYPALRQVGYGEKFSLGLVTSSGSLGLLLAPSLPLILYGIIAQQMNIGPQFTIQELFIAGCMPALFMILALSAYSLFANRRQNIERQTFSKEKLFQALWSAKWEIPLPFFVLGGIYSGFFALSETAAVATLYIAIVEIFIHKEIRLKQVGGILTQAMTMVGGIILILAASLALTNVMVDAQIPTKFFDWTQSFLTQQIPFLILLNIFLLIVGAIIDIFSAIVILVPLILPLAIAYGIHPVHLGVIFLANMQIGYFTPPVGMNLFIASYRFKKPITTLYQATIPFMLVLMLTVLIITYVPEISLFFIK
jgi:tripartite ATP-independent transporter DctM subunit